LENPVKLPFLNIELPLLAFFFLAPILFIVVHAYTLVHLVMLTEKTKRYHRALHDPTRDLADATRENLQWQLPSNIFIQLLAGPSGLRGGLFGWLLRAIGRVTLLIAPVLLLLMMQVQFLPFHSSFITWTQRIALVIDVLLIWWLWGKVLSGREVDGHRRGSWAWASLGCAFSLAAILFSGAAATFPGEWQEDHQPQLRFLPALTEWGKLATKKDARGDLWTASFQDWVANANRLSLHDWLFNEDPDPVSRRRVPFSNTLVLTGLNIYEGLGIDDPEKAKWHDFVFRARGRDLNGAIFDLASLPKVDFEGAELKDASLKNAKLQSTSFQAAKLQGAELSEAQLQGANFGFARLQGASLYRAQLQGANFGFARLQGASLEAAQLQGANFGYARLHGTSLTEAHLQGVYFGSAQLQGASLVDAQLQGASLQLAHLQATDLSNALLWRTNRPALPHNLGSRTAVRLSGDQWMPLLRDDDNDNEFSPWNSKAYEDLHKMIESLLPGVLRDEALYRIRRLDCANPDKALASCDPSVQPPPQAADWRKALEAVGVDDAAYLRALAQILGALVCSPDEDAIYIVRGLIFNRRLEGASLEAESRTKDLATADSKDCPVAAALTDADRANLLQIKQEAAAAAGRAYSP
jgi:uncharacterized protein YjbI with pentapeptide repeats